MTQTSVNKRMVTNSKILELNDVRLFWPKCFCQNTKKDLNENRNCSGRIFGKTGQKLRPVNHWRTVRGLTVDSRRRMCALEPKTAVWPTCFCSECANCRARGIYPNPGISFVGIHNVSTRECDRWTAIGWMKMWNCVLACASHRPSYWPACVIAWHRKFCTAFTQQLFTDHSLW